MKLSRIIFAVAISSLALVSPILAGDGTIRRAAEPVPGLYLVQLKGVEPVDVPLVAQSLIETFGGQLRLIFQHANTGFSAAMTDQQALALALHPLVDFVEEVALTHLSSEQPLPTPDETLSLP